MRDDDDIIEAYELDFEASPARRGSNRRFWLVLGTIVVGCVVVLVEIFANRQIANTIGHAQFDLRRAEAAARAIEANTGTFTGAGAEGLNAARLDDGKLTAIGPDEASSGLGEVSVYADAATWAAAVTARPGACFYLKLVDGEADPSYGVGTTCTGRAALSARDDRW